MTPLRRAWLHTSLCLMLACGTEPSAPPRLSSLAGLIVFQSNSPGSVNADIYAIAPSGGQLVNLTRHRAFYDVPAPSPDGSVLAFYRSRSPGDSGDIFVMRADGTELRQLTFNPNVESDLAWRSDGGRLAFVRDHEIYTMAPDGSDVLQLTHDGAPKFTPSWSPDGAYIVYSGPGAQGIRIALHRMTAAGNGDTVLIGGQGDYYQPSWAPDGLSIAFSHQDGGYASLERLDLTTGLALPVTSGFVSDQWPSWSASGTMLAFLRIPNQPGIPRIGEIYIVTLGALNPVQVSHFGGARGIYAPRWAP